MLLCIAARYKKYSALRQSGKVPKLYHTKTKFWYNYGTLHPQFIAVKCKCLKNGAPYRIQNRIKERKTIMKKIKKLLALLLAIVVTMSTTPAKVALADTRWDLFAYSDSNWLYPENHPYGTLLWFEVNGSAVHHEGFLSSYYSATGGLTTGVYGKKTSADLLEKYYWTSVSGLISMYSSQVGSLSGTISYSEKGGVGGSGSASLSAGQKSVSYSMEPESYASFGLDATAVGFTDISLTITSYGALISKNSHMVFGALDYSRTYPLKLLMDY